MKSAEKKLPTMEPRISQSVKPKRSTTKTEDPARMKTTDELLRQVINEAKAFCRPATLKSGSKKLETFNARRWLVRGRVQGVGYRWFAQKSAAGLGLSGYARNLDDERVEVYAAGTEAKLAELAGLLYRGPRWADVRSVEEQECAVQELGSFRIEA